MHNHHHCHHRRRSCLHRYHHVDNYHGNVINVSNYDICNNFVSSF